MAVENVDVLVIGAGPSGAIAAALLVKKGYSVRVVEKETFPRFSIGESLLPQCMQYIEEAGMLPAVEAGDFQFKCGAAFLHKGNYTEFDFRKKFSPGWGTTFQVDRSKFDKILADEAERMGADIRYQHEITDITFSDKHQPQLTVVNSKSEKQTIEAKFVLDASGFGRVLPRLLDLSIPSEFPIRQSVFTQVTGLADSDWYDSNKILITIHPEQRDVWYWLIPLGKGRASIGVVAKEEFLEGVCPDGKDTDPEQLLRTVITAEPMLLSLLERAEFTMPVRKITGYSSNVKSLHGQNYALLGNAGEFLDPVFSSGVTIAMRSASMAAALVDRQLQGEDINWEEEFSLPLNKGINTFRTFVNAWYDQRFQDVVFHQHDAAPTEVDTQPIGGVRSMIASILAGYAWDENNPYVKDSTRRLNVLADICQQEQ